MPVYPDLFRICRTSDKKAWSVQRALFGYTPFAPVSSVGRFGLKMYFDIHTHHLSACPSEAIYNADSNYMPTPDEAIYISVGIHPWHLTDEDYPVRLQWVESMLQDDKRIIALGEAGLDKCCDAPFALQEEAFRKVISLSEQYCLPLYSCRKGL